MSTIAQPHVRGGAQLSVKAISSAGRVEYDAKTGTMSAKGGVRLTLTTGTNSVIVESDEIESLPVLDDRILKR